MTATPSVVLEATAVHDDAMLARVTSAIGLHPVGSFSYTPDEAGTATILIEVRGDERQQSRVRSRLQRLVGVLDVTGPAASRSTT